MKTKNFDMVRIITFVQQRFYQFGPVLIRASIDPSPVCAHISAFHAWTIIHVNLLSNHQVSEEFTLKKVEVYGVAYCTLRVGNEFAVTGCMNCALSLSGRKIN